MKLTGVGHASQMRSAAAYFGQGDILYGRLRPYLNKVCRPDFEGLASAEFIVFPSQANLNNGYLQYFLNSWEFVSYASRLNTGDRPRVDFDQIAEYPFPLAPLPEQLRIVAEIEKHSTRLDAAVASLKRAKANLKRCRASVLKTACEGRLVPTEAELARREGRDYEPASVLLERILQERRAKWAAQPRSRGKYKEPLPPDAGNLPPLPEGWAWVRTTQISEASLGKMLDRKRTAGRPQPYLRNLNVRWNGFDLSGLVEMPFKENEFDKYALLPGDVLICEGGEPGRAAVWPGNDRPVKYQKAIHRVRLYGNIEPRWLVYCLWNDANMGKLERYFTGTTIKHFTGVSLERYLLPLPPITEQRRIVAEVERHLSLTQASENVVEANLKRAERLRQAILRSAFQGKLVPQDPTYKPASVLLERIRAEREQRLEQDGRRKPRVVRQTAKKKARA